MRGGPRSVDRAPGRWPANPLDLTAAGIFAVLFVVVSVAASWAQSRYGTVGIYGLAAVVGVTDIDPFVLSLAQHGTGQLPAGVAAFAIVVATSSNNMLKAAYALAYSGGRWRRSTLVAHAARRAHCMHRLVLLGCIRLWIRFVHRPGARPAEPEPKRQSLSLGRAG